VYLAEFWGSGSLDHYTIFVHTTDGDRGEPRGPIFHVTGSLQNGMVYETKVLSPTLSATFKSLRHIGWISHDRFIDIEVIALTVPVPKKQYNGPKLLVPRNQVRHCQHWAAETIEELRKGGVLSPLAPNESALRYVQDHDGNFVLFVEDSENPKAEMEVEE